MSNLKNQPSRSLFSPEPNVETKLWEAIRSCFKKRNKVFHTIIPTSSALTSELQQLMGPVETKP